MRTLLNTYKTFLLSAVLLLSLSSCEKEIDVDLRPVVPPIITIEGIVKQDQLATVRVSHTLDFNNNDGYPNLSGAIVKISDNQGNSEILKQDANGWYTAQNLKGVIGRTYNMSVTYEGQEYTATSQMPTQASLESITIKKVAAIDNPFLELHIDPIYNTDQYYRALLFINGKQDRDLPEYVMSTELMNDKSQPYKWGLQVFSNDSDIDPIKKGDKVTIELQCIDKGTHKFFDTLVNSVGTPTNPISNISNGALGYFSACTSEKKTITADWED